MRELFEKYGLREWFIIQTLDNLENKESSVIPFNFTSEIDTDEFVREINESTEYVAAIVNNEITIKKLTFVSTDKQTFLRLGFIPENEESYNYISKENEKGVSVFELENNLPFLSNLQLIDSFSGRYKFTPFIVTGNVVGRGIDGDVLLNNVEYVSVTKIDFKEITVNALRKNFSTITDTEITETKEMFTYYNEESIEVSYRGFEFTEPKESFDLKMGWERK